jgi:5-enolpyruvylshikimate-3-phosphate synthase
MRPHERPLNSLAEAFRAAGFKSSQETQKSKPLTLEECEQKGIYRKVNNEQATANSSNSKPEPRSN